jgi:glycerate kinase
MSVGEWCAVRGISVEEIENGHDLQAARLFPVCSSVEELGAVMRWMVSEKIKGADLIITGEGKADRQTAMGKVPYGILKEAQKEHIPVIVLAGSIENLPELNKAGFKGIFSIAPGPITLEKAMEPEFAKENITRLVSQLYSVITSFG